MKHRWYVSAAIGTALTGLAFGAQAGDLVEYQIVGADDEAAIPASLTDKPGNPENGRKVVRAKSKGTCLACHVMPIPEDADHGLIGPPLDDVGSRLTAGQIRLRVVNPKIVNPDTMMPAYYRVDGLHRVLEKWKHKTFMTAQEVEDVVAYLVTLKATDAQ